MPVEHSAAGVTGDAARREHGLGGGGNRDALDHHVGDDGSPLAWAEPVLGRREGGVGPVLDVALVIVQCAAGGHAPTAVTESATAGLDAAGGGGGGLEARVKIRLDAVRTDLSVPFVENIARHVLTGPLVSQLLLPQPQGDSSAGAASRDRAASSAAASPSQAPAVPTAVVVSPPVVGGAQAAADEGLGRDFSDSNGTAAAAAAGANGAGTTTTGAPAGSAGTGWGDGPRQGGGAEDDNSWEKLVFIKVRAWAAEGQQGPVKMLGLVADAWRP